MVISSACTTHDIRIIPVENMLRREILLQERRENSICYYIHGLIKKNKFREYWSKRFLFGNTVWKTDEQ